MCVWLGSDAVQLASTQLFSNCFIAGPKTRILLAAVDLRFTYTVCCPHNSHNASIYDFGINRKIIRTLSDSLLSFFIFSHEKEIRYRRSTCLEQFPRRLVIFLFLAVQFGGESIRFFTKTNAFISRQQLSVKSLTTAKGSPIDQEKYAQRHQPMHTAVG